MRAGQERKRGRNHRKKTRNKVDRKPLMKNPKKTWNKREKYLFLVVIIYTVDGHKIHENKSVEIVNNSFKRQMHICI